MLKNDFESTNFANFEEVIHNFGRSDDDLVKKMLIFNICRRGLMPNLIKKSLTASNQDTGLFTCSSVLSGWFFDGILTKFVFWLFLEKIGPQKSPSIRLS